jgi:hypothetical protein
MTFAELEKQIYKDLRRQHPEWVGPNGKCPECDEHEARLKEIFEALAQNESKAETSQ